MTDPPLLRHARRACVHFARRDPPSAAGSAHFCPRDPNCTEQLSRSIRRLSRASKPLGALPAFRIGGRPRGGDHGRLARRRQVRPSGIPRSGRTRLRCLDHRQIRLEQRPTRPGLRFHPAFCRVTGLEILLLGRIRANVDPGRHAARGQSDGARWRRGRAAGDVRRPCRRGRDLTVGDAMRAPYDRQQKRRDNNRAPPPRMMTAPAHRPNLCNTGGRDGALRILQVLSALTRRRLPDPLTLELPRCLFPLRRVPSPPVRRGP